MIDPENAFTAHKYGMRNVGVWGNLPSCSVEVEILPRRFCSGVDQKSHSSRSPQRPQLSRTQHNRTRLLHVITCVNDQFVTARTNVPNAFVMEMEASANVHSFMDLMASLLE